MSDLLIECYIESYRRKMSIDLIKRVCPINDRPYHEEYGIEFKEKDIKFTKDSEVRIDYATVKAIYDENPDLIAQPLKERIRRGKLTYEEQQKEILAIFEGYNQD